MIGRIVFYFFRWADESSVGAAIRASTWVFAFIEVFHLLGLTLLLGTVVLVDLRLCGYGLRRQSMAEVASDALPWMLVGMVVTMGSGSLLFVSEAMKCYGSPPFFVKMGLLFTALVFTFTLHRKLTKRSTPPPPVWGKVAAGLSLFLWFGVGLAGRAIAFY
jgi:hypothetical protein